jgi:NAD(P)H-flavin reductase/ferredoxin
MEDGTMFSLFQKKPLSTLKVNDSQQIISLERKETILTAALRSGIAIPNSCRVGGCASCKCKLIKGSVKELTESSYVLSEQELADGFILACQSVPKEPVEIEVALDEIASQFCVKKIKGVITAQEKLTHDITALQIDLSEPMEYIPGQYAELSIPSLSKAIRAYSFASPADGKTVEFYIREVSGGELSPIINVQELLNAQVVVNGPVGDFYLRESDAPIVCIAGGSGLAPIKALLEQGLKDKLARDVVFIFGARTQADLYCSQQIASLETRWKGSFKYIPVLSDEPMDSSWQGARGYVTEPLDNLLTGLEHAYLCGPPLMIDAAVDVLKKHGILSSHIHFDKFVSKADVVAA